MQRDPSLLVLIVIVIYPRRRSFEYGQEAGIETEKSRKICAIGIVFAVLLAVGITYSGLVLMSLSAESREMNSDVAHGSSVYCFVVNGLSSGSYIGLFEINATAVFPRAIVEDGYDFFMYVTFAMMLPANASGFSEVNVEAAFSPGPNPDYEFNKSVAYGDDPNGGVLANGVPTGGTGVGFWNVTMEMGILRPPTVDISQNQSWLSFISQAETHLSILLEGVGNMTAANGTACSYWLSTSFNFQGTPATFYGFGLSVGAWLVYGGSILIGIASLYYLRRLPKKEIRKQTKFRLCSLVPNN